MQLRPAVSEDREALARLLVQLYAFEVPGMMHGAEARQVELARRIVTVAPAGLRFVLEVNESIVGMGSIATTQQPRPPTPSTVVLQALPVLGPVHGLRTIAGAARGVLSVAGTPTLNEAHIHSLVIDARHRGRGLGSVLLARLENQALNRGKIDAVLQVVTSNRTAQAFYRSRGYQPTGRTAAGIRRVLGYPTILMRKDLQRPAN